nr:MAG: RNA-dependent RNA polymerase [Wufeng bat jingchuvirus 1]
MFSIKIPDNSFSLSPSDSVLRYQRRFATALDLTAVTDDVIVACQSSFPDCTRGTGDLLARILPDHLLNSSFSSQVDTIDAHHISSLVTEVQCKWLTDRTNIPLRMIKTYHNRVTSERIDSMCSWALTIDRLLYRLKKDILCRRKNDAVNQLLPYTSIVRFSLLGDFVALEYLPTRCVYIYPLCVLSMFVSKSFEFGLFLYYLTNQPRPDIRHIINSAFKFFRLLQSVLLTYGNLGYTILKTIDGICQGVTIIRGDPSHNPFLLDNIVQGLKNDELWSKDIAGIIDLMMKIPLMDVMNFGGIVKLFGHPEINCSAGLEKLYKRTHHPIEIEEKSIVNVLSMAKLMFIRQYYTRHQRYPPLSFNANVPRPLIHRIIRNERIPEARTSDMNGITLMPCSYFDYFERLYPLIKDKAISEPRYVIEQTFIDKSISSLSSRALLDYVTRPDVQKSWELYFRRFERNPLLCRNQFVIKLTFKELEQKIDGRLFGASPLEERTRRVAMESNVCSLMESYLPDQAMTLNDMEKRMKMYYLRNSEALHKDMDQFIVAVDAEAWNNYFRSCLVDRFGAEIFDRIFGTNCYRSVMSVFNQGLIYNIRQDNTLTAWNGQEGGIEGLAQKVWTWIYCCIARLVIEEVGAEGHLLVNGDDLRMILYVPRQKVEEHDDYHQYLLDALKQSFDAYGVRMKRDETVITKDFISFSRQAMINGVNIPSDWKKILKCTGMADTALPLLSEITSSIFSNAHSAAGQSYLTLPAYRTALFSLSMYLLFDKLIIPTRQKTELFRQILILTTPAIVGGLETIMLPTMMMQGESDHLPIFIDWCKYLVNHHPDSQDAIRQIFSLTARSRSHGIDQLLSNPYSLPLSTTDHPKSIIRSRIRRFLPNITNNLSLYALETFDTRYRPALVKSLTTMAPFSARIASLLYSLTPCALLDSIISKFENSRTVAALYLTRRGSRLTQFLRSVFLSDTRYMRLRCAPIRTVNSLGVEVCNMLAEGVCGTRVADLLREQLWQMGQLADVTQPSWIQQLKIWEGYAIPREVRKALPEEHFTGTTAPCVPQGEFSGVLARAPYKPFFEARTEEKLSERFSLTGHYEPLVDSIRKLTSALALLEGHGPELAEWIDVMSMSLFGERITQFVPTITSRISGTITHRLHSKRYIPTIYMNCLPSRSSKCYVDLDSNKFTNRVLKENRKYNYTAFRVGLLWTLTSGLESDVYMYGSRVTYWAALSECGIECTCHDPILEGVFNISPPPLALQNAFSRLVQTNRLLRLTPETIGELSTYRIEFFKKWGLKERTVCRIVSSLDEITDCAITHILERIKESDMRSFEGSVRDLELYNQVIGAKLPLSDFSCKDIMLLDTDKLLLRCLEQCQLNLYISRGWGDMPLSRLINCVTPKAFILSLCMHFVVVKNQYSLLTSLNKILESYDLSAIIITYALLTSPETLAISVIDAFVRLLHRSVHYSVSVIRRLHVYLPSRPSSAFEDLTACRLIYGSILSTIGLQRISGKWWSELQTQGETSIQNLSRVQSISLAAGCMTIEILESTTLLYPEGAALTTEFHIPQYPENVIPDCAQLSYYSPVDNLIHVQTIPQHIRIKVRHSVGVILEEFARRQIVSLSITVYRLAFPECVHALRYDKDPDIDPNSGEPCPISMLPLCIQINDTNPVCVYHVKGGSANLISSNYYLTEDDERVLGSFLPELPRDQRPKITASSFYRPLNLSTTALNKYLEILAFIINTEYHKAHSFGMIASGDGSGGVSVALTKWFPKATVVFNTLIAEGSLQYAHCADAAFLTADERNRLKYEHNQGGLTDLTDPNIALYLYDVLNTQPFLLFTCDAESKDIEHSSTDRNLCKTMALITCVYLDHGGSTILKRYITSSRWNCSLFSLLRFCFEHVYIVKPLSSNELSGEIFLVASNKVRSLSTDLVQNAFELYLSTPNDWDDFSIFMKTAHQRRRDALIRLQSLRNTRTPGNWISSHPVNPILRDAIWAAYQAPISVLTELFSDDGIQIYHPVHLLTKRQEFLPILRYKRDELLGLLNSLASRPTHIPFKRLEKISFHIGIIVALESLTASEAVSDIKENISDLPEYKIAEPNIKEHTQKNFLKGIKFLIRIYGMAY